MDAPLDLYGGSRDELLALVVGQRERIAALAARQARQEAARAQQRGVIGPWLVSDLYAVYTAYAGRHQFCWAPLLRDGNALVSQHRDEAAVRGWADGVPGLDRRATACTPPDPAVRCQQRQGDEAALATLCAPYLGGETAPQRVLCERLVPHLAERFVFVAHPAVPPTTTAAERRLRHLVTSRTISGGTRSPPGTTTKMTLATLGGTWRLHGRPPGTECRALLANPQL